MPDVHLFVSSAPVQGAARATVCARLDDLLSPALFQDHGPNGLQVEGRAHIGHMVTGVTASLALIEAAVAAQADAILVHHGLFWKGQEGRVTGWLKQRLSLLLAHDINLFAYHLPLDAHPHVGNNVQLARVLGWQWQEGPGARFGPQNLGLLGACEPTDLSTLAQHIAHTLRRTPTVVGDAHRRVARLGWCTGGAQSYFEAAIAAGVDVFVTGEISEPQAHLARETGVAFIACGHHASERYGAAAAGAWLAHTLGLRHTFIDIDNPA
jgi:dinuclear metal center YbgI/SA1388 family protein